LKEHVKISYEAVVLGCNSERIEGENTWLNRYANLVKFLMQLRKN
jgi:hypothetical protein